MKLIRKFKKTSKTCCDLHKVYSVFTVSIVAVMIASTAVLNFYTTTAFAANSSNMGQPVVKLKKTVQQTKTKTQTANCKPVNLRRINRTKKINTYQDSIKHLKMQLIHEVKTYMNKNAKNPKMSARHIVNACIQNNFDISLLLSQAHFESHFGSYMKGNSCFGVTTRGYANTNQAVDEYIRLMQSKYIVNRTVEQVIASNFNVEGSRKYFYAGSSSYGAKIKSLRRNIITNTKIHNLFTTLRDLNTELAILQQAHEEDSIIDLYNTLPDIKRA